MLMLQINKNSSTQECRHLTRSAVIYHDGTVTCCPMKYFVLGNIHQNSLRELYDSSWWRRTKDCQKDCHSVNMCSPGNPTYDDLEYIEILFGLDCPIHCVMCPMPRALDQLDFELVVKQVDIRPFKTIALFGGEPFFMPESRRYMDYLIDVGKKQSAYTNALCLTKEDTRKIAHHFKWLAVSLNAATKKTHECINRGSNWETVLQNSKSILEEKGIAKIIAHMTLRPENLEEIPAFLDFYKAFGFHECNFNHDSGTVPQYLTEHPSLKKQLKDKLNAIHRRHPIDTAHILRFLGLLD